MLIKTIALLITFSILLPINANMGPQGFGRFLNHYFVETGTYGGDGILKALKTGFKEVRSIDCNRRNVMGTRLRFAHYPTSVKLWHGDSATTLWHMIKDIDQPATFWLDAHVFPPQLYGKNCPLIAELEQIKWHPIKTHTILIDDMHCAGTAAFDYLTREDLIAKILEINPNYTISYVPGGDDGEYPTNVMVATCNESLT